MYSSFFYIIDILGTFAFAASGALLAMERRLDAFGVLIIAFVTAIGGGTIRDLLVGRTPVGWLQNGVAILVISSAALLTMLLGRRMRSFTKALFLFDALGLGLFTLIGIEVGLQYRLGAGVCIALGTITACFGGVLRDVLLNQVPLIFQKEIYALACIGGGCFYFALRSTGLNDDWLKTFCILLIFLIRLVAVRYKLSLPPVAINAQP